MFKNIIPSLISFKSDLRNIKGFYHSDDFNFYTFVEKKNKFHYQIIVDDNLEIPKNYDFRNGHYYKKDDIWFYKKNVLFFTLKFSYNMKNNIFRYNRIYSLIPFEIGHIWPAGRHISDIINLELFLKGFIFIRGCAARYHGKNIAFIAPSHSGKTSLINWIIDKGGKYISEEFFILDIKKGKIYPSSCLTAYGRSNNLLLNKKLQVNDINDIIDKGVNLNKIILFLNKTDQTYIHDNKSVFDFIIMRSLFFLKNDLIKSYIFTENLTEKVFQIIDNLKKINIKNKFIQISNYNFNDLFKE